MEFYDRRFAEHLEANDNWVFITSYVRKLLMTQAVNLSRLGYELKNIEFELAILAPREYPAIRDILEGKTGRIHALISALQAGLYVYGTLPEDRGEMRRLLLGDEDLGLALSGIVISSSQDWNIDVHDRIHSHLEATDPRRQLDHLQSCAETLRVMLIEHFNLDEILWTVEDYSRDLGRAV